MLPFSLVGELRQAISPEISLPVYESLTVSEAKALEQLFTPELEALLASELGIAASLHARIALAAVLLVSRHDASLTLAQVAQMPLEVIASASDFLLAERSGMTGRGDGAPTDWADLYWSLQRHYPHEPRFSAERLGDCPMALIEQALKSQAKERLEQLAADAAAIALHGAYSLRASGVKEPQVEWFNPWSRLVEQNEARNEIDPETARLFLELSAESAVPAWAVGLVDVEKMRRAAA